ncbi:MAG TPA: ATP-binding cassette domain-containing protein [Gemmataceae bacterium]|nr:ATP-binding cassette domain-containing protein [Gemmataceae bacterium]
MSEPVIEVENLSKTYPDGTEAVRGVSFRVGRGEFFGFLGPNGAGKSTTIKVLITLLDKTAGSARVFGHDTDCEAAAVRRRLGYSAQEIGLDDDLTGRENLLLQGRLHHLPTPLLRQRVDELLALMGLAGDADRAAGAYSGGMRKRLDLATGLIHRPELLVLDEPTTGLDPQNRAGLWKHLERLNKEEGLTIFLTTHYMEEADRLCDRLAIIDHGRLIAEGSPAGLKAQLGGDVVRLTFKDDGAAAPERAAALLRSLAFVRDVTAADDGVSVIVEDGGAAVPELLRVLNAAGLGVARLSLTSPTLDDVFLKHTGHTIRQDELDRDWRSARGLWGPVRRGRRGGGRRSCPGEPAA